jgi:hypothetical protein
MSSSSSASGVEASAAGGVGVGKTGCGVVSSSVAACSSTPIRPTACLIKPKASPNEKPDFAAGA